MAIEKVTIRRGATINLGNYETSRVDVEMTASVGRGEDLEEGYAELAEEVECALVHEVERLEGRYCGKRAVRFMDKCC